MHFISYSIYFCIKKQFLINSSLIFNTLDGASIPGKHRGLGVKICRLRVQHQWMAGYFL
jgi:hypothetical protein